MKEIDDEELQRFIEQELKAGHPTAASHDVDEELYSDLFIALAQEPPLPEHSNLANNVIRTIEHQEAKRETIRYSLSIASVLAGSLLLMGIALLFINPAILNTILSEVKSNKWIAVFVIAAITAIEITDRKLVKNKLSIDQRTGK